MSGTRLYSALDGITITPEQEKINNEVVDILLSRVQNKLKNEVKDLINPSVKALRDLLSRRTWKILQEWSDWDGDGPILYPTGPSGGTRLYYRKGKTSVLIYEQPPTARSLFFNRDAFKTSKSNFHLALPYIIFLIVFKDGKFNSFYVTYLKESLKNLSQKPLVPNLPNIGGNLSICMGDFFEKTSHVGKTIDQLTLATLDHFWKAEFSHGTLVRMPDKRLETLETWESASKENPMFPLSVEWIPSSHYVDYRHMLQQLFSGDSEVSRMNNDLFQDLSNEAAEEIATALGVMTSRKQVDLVSEDLTTEIKRLVKAVTQVF